MQLLYIDTPHERQIQLTYLPQLNRTHLTTVCVNFHNISTIEIADIDRPDVTATVMCATLSSRNLFLWST